MSQWARLEFDYGNSQSCNEVDFGILAKPLRILLEQFNIISIARRRGNIDRCRLGFEILPGAFVGWRERCGGLFEQSVDVFVLKEATYGRAPLSFS